MTIRNRQSFERAIWDWSILKGCFGSNVKASPSDIDGVLERHGHFLWIETKAPGVMLPKGQAILLQQLAKRGDTVLIVHGEQDSAESITLLKGAARRVYENANNETLRKIVSDWYNWANKQPDTRHRRVQE